MMTLDETVVGIWFVELPIGDWMATVNREAAGGFSMTMRFRWYNDEKAFGSTDDKRWSRVTIPDRTTDQVIDLITDLAEQLRAKAGRKSYRLLRDNRTLDEFMKEFARQPFVHIQTERLH